MQVGRLKLFGCLAPLSGVSPCMNWNIYIYRHTHMLYREKKPTLLNDLMNLSTSVFFFCLIWVSGPACVHLD